MQTHICVSERLILWQELRYMCQQNVCALTNKSYHNVNLGQKKNLTLLQLLLSTANSVFFIPSICFKVYTCQIFWKVAVLIVLGFFLQSKSAFVLWFPGSAVRGFHREIFHDLQLYSFMLKSYGIRFGGSLFKVCYLCTQHTPLRPAANQR